MSEQVSHDQGGSRFVIEVDGEPAGFAHYTVRDGVAVFDHTEIDPRFEGRGLGTTLVRAALDQVRAEGRWRVRATCPFVRAFLRKNRDYADLLA